MAAFTSTFASTTPNPPRHSQALQAELSGDYDAALKIYKKLMARYDTRYEQHADSQDSTGGLDAQDEDGGDKDGEWQFLVLGLAVLAGARVFVASARLTI